MFYSFHSRSFENLPLWIRNASSNRWRADGTGLLIKSALAVVGKFRCSPQGVMRLNWRERLFGEANLCTPRFSYIPTAAAKKKWWWTSSCFPNWEDMNNAQKLIVGVTSRL
jgi:hypothetical protein